MSLASRISVVTGVLLAICTGAAGIALYSRVKAALHDELEARCLARWSAMHSILEFDDGKLDFDEKDSALLGVDRWKIAAGDGTVLWTSQWIDGEKHMLTKTKNIVI